MVFTSIHGEFIEPFYAEFIEALWLNVFSRQMMGGFDLEIETVHHHWRLLSGSFEVNSE